MNYRWHGFTSTHNCFCCGEMSSRTHLRSLLWGIYWPERHRDMYMAACTEIPNDLSLWDLLIPLFFALAGLVIPLLTLLKMTDFPFWISESRTSISEPVKLFFLRLDAILMTQHSTLPGIGEKKRSLIFWLFWAWSMQIYYPCAFALKYALVAFIIYAGRLHTFSEVKSVSWIWCGVFVRDLYTKKVREI